MSLKHNPSKAKPIWYRLYPPCSGLCRASTSRSTRVSRSAFPDFLNSPAQYLCLESLFNQWHMTSSALWIEDQACYMITNQLRLIRDTFSVSLVYHSCQWPWPVGRLSLASARGSAHEGVPTLWPPGRACFFLSSFVCIFCLDRTLPHILLLNHAIHFTWYCSIEKGNGNCCSSSAARSRVQAAHWHCWRTNRNVPTCE